MSHDPLDRAIIDFYQQKELRPEVFERLQTLAELSGQESPTTRLASEFRQKTVWTRVWLGTAIVSAAALLLALVMTRDPAGKSHLDGQSVAEEIAFNHRKQLAVEFSTTSYETLSTQMAKLNFRPQQAIDSNADDYRLLGARYCSIKDAIAAQLKIVDDTGQVHTLYQTRWAERYRALPDQAIEVDGVVVRFWRQADVLFGLAQTTQASPAL